MTASAVRLVAVVVPAVVISACGGGDGGQSGDGGDPVVSTTLSSDPAVAFCQLMQQTDDVEPDGSETPDELEAKLAALDGILERVAEIAPAEIDAEVEQSVSAYSQLIDVVAEAGYQIGAADPDRVGELSDEIDANGNVIQNWLDENCTDG